MVEASGSLTAAPRSHRPWLAGLLSFLVPGLGQAYAGRWRPAILFAVPVIALVVLALLAWSGAIGELRNRILSSEVLAAVAIGNVGLFLLRATAIGHAAMAARDASDAASHRTAALAAAVLIVAAAGMHLWVGAVVSQLDGTLGRVFAGDAPREDEPPTDPGEPPTEDDPGGPQPTPVYRWDGDERVNILLVGTDAAPGRDAVLTDVIMVLSVDPAERTAVLISVPRDTGFVPLERPSPFAGDLYPGKVNELAARGALDPASWCGDDRDPQGCGLEVLRSSVGLYLGIELHNHAIVDMLGFAEMIDAVGGLQLCLPGRLVDPEFDGTLENRGTDEPLVLPAGCHQYDGLEALAYARSRQGWIEMPGGERVPQTDFDRNERQQRVLLALREELAQANTLLELPGLLAAIGRSISTDFPREQAGDLASLLPLITGPDIERVVLGYPEFVDLPVDPEANYLLIPRREAIRDEMARLFGASELRGWYLEPSVSAPDDAGEES